MYDPTFLSRVSVAVHEDRALALRRSRRNRQRDPGNPAYRVPGLCRRLMCRLQARPARVAS
jgi:hypothetical protein